MFNKTLLAKNYLKLSKHPKIYYSEIIIFLLMDLEAFVLFYPCRQDLPRYFRLVRTYNARASAPLV